MNSHLLIQSQHAPRCNEHFTAGPERAWGIVQNVDLVGRDLTVLFSGGLEIFDIPPHCPISLHGEQIKLRMVQPRDQVWITFHRTPQRAVAEQVEVQPDTGFSCFRL